MAAAALGLAGCGRGGEGNAPATDGGAGASAAGGPRLLFISNSNSDWFNAVEKGMLDAAAKYGARVELRRNEGQTQPQIKLLEDALSLPDVQGVAVSVIEAEAPGIADAMRALQKAGKVVITFDSDITAEASDARAGYIGTNNVNAGIVAGQAAAALRPDGGKVCTFVGTSSAANARERKQGFFQGAGGKFVDAETFDDGADKARAASNVQTALSKHPDVGVLLGLWSYNAPAIAEEIAAAPQRRTRTTVVTFDLDELAVDHLARGNVDATVVQNPYEMGYQSVRLLKALIEKDTATSAEILGDDQTRDTGVRVIVPKADSPVKGDNVITIDEMKTWLESKGLKSS